MRHRASTVMMIIAAAAGGCAGGYRGETAPAPAPLAAEYGVAAEVEAASGAAGDGAGAPADPALGEITLEEAVSLALSGNPSLAVSGWDRRIGDAAVSEAGISPNPEIGFEMENFGGTGAQAGTGASEATLELSQEIELGGKRRNRVAAASYARDLAGWDHE
ncbi:MAG: TolC family protein, partial [Candidatus Krumholzibacteria bacterium]|nr:TolC family protein [Candidatus Krumholzibacteria bacterium]